MHVVGREQVHGLLGAGGTVQHQPDGQGRVDDGFAGLLIGGLAIQRQHGDRDALLVDAVIAGKRPEQASRPVHFSGIGYVIAHDGVQGAEGDGRIAVLWGDDACGADAVDQLVQVYERERQRGLAYIAMPHAGPPREVSAQLLVGHLAVCRGRRAQAARSRVCHMRLNRGKLQFPHESACSFTPALELEAHHAARAMRQVFLRGFVIGVGRQSAVVDGLHLRMLRQEFCHRLRIFAVARHAHMQTLKSKV